MKLAPALPPWVIAAANAEMARRRASGELAADARVDDIEGVIYVTDMLVFQMTFFMTDATNFSVIRKFEVDDVSLSDPEECGRRPKLHLVC